jgi:GINS complex subunit 1
MAVPGVRAKVLVTELRRAKANGGLHLPRFNEDGLRTVLSESKELFEELKELMDDQEISELPDPVKIACQVHHASIKRNKRCALAYVENRSTTIKALRWELGPLPDEDVMSNMSHREKTLFSEYDKLISEYNQEMGIDLMADLTPPKDLLIQVRVLRDCGEIMTEGGALTLEQGTTHSLRRRDVEHLVRQGYLEEHQQHESC